MIGLGLVPGLDLLGWSVALGFGCLAGGLWLREGRRRGSLNRGLHELRRPLQVLTLMAPGPRLHDDPAPHARVSPAPRRRPSAQRLAASAPNGPASLEVLEQALGAVADLDRAVNGPVVSMASKKLRSSSGGRLPDEPVCLREQVERLISRWQALRGAGELRLQWDAGEALVLVDTVRFRQALENLLANACEHGRLPITVTASVLPGRVRVAVADAGPARRVSPPAKATGRHGHGLAVAAEFAAASGGALRSWRCRDGGTVVAVDLPVAPPHGSTGPSLRPSLAGPAASAAPLTR